MQNGDKGGGDDVESASSEAVMCVFREKGVGKEVPSTEQKVEYVDRDIG